MLGYIRNSAAFRAAGFWSLVGAVIGGAITIAAGYIDMNRAALGETHEYVDFHLKVGWLLFVATVALMFRRWFLYAKPERQPNWVYLVATLLVFGLTLFQGWYGGEMVYSQGAGIAAAGKGTEPSSSGHSRLDKVTNALGGESHSNEEHQESPKDKDDSQH